MHPLVLINSKWSDAFMRCLAFILLLMSLPVVAQVQLVKDINPGPASSSSNLTYREILVGNTFFLSVDDGVHGKELWKSDGTTAGTVLVKDINPGAASSSIQFMQAINGIAFFIADDGVHGQELWKSDGTPAGTILVKDMNPGSHGSGRNGVSEVNIAINGVLYMMAEDDLHGLELWKSDGTAAGTMLIKDINPGVGGSNPVAFSNIDGILYFTAFETDFIWPGAIWKSDGTTAGTVKFLDLTAATNTNGVHGMIRYNGTIYFTTLHNDVISLWTTDGTVAGTQEVLSSYNDNGNSWPAGLLIFQGKLYFAITYDAKTTDDYNIPASISIYSYQTGQAVTLAQDIRGEFGGIGILAHQLCAFGSQLYVNHTGNANDFHNVTSANSNIAA